MHADSRPDDAETPWPDGAPPFPLLPPWLAQLIQGQRIYITGPEPVASYPAYQPSSFLAIEDEIAGFPSTTHTLTHDPQQAMTRAAAVVAALVRTNALLATCLASHGAFAARVRFLRATEELTTAPGVSQRELDALKSGLLAMAQSPAPQPTQTPRTDAGRFTHTVIFSPRKNGKSEALRRARAEHAGEQATS